MDNAQSRNRTSDTRIFSPLLYQLSYLGIRSRKREPRASGLSSQTVQACLRPAEAEGPEPWTRIYEATVIRRTKFGGWAPRVFADKQNAADGHDGHPPDVFLELRGRDLNPRPPGYEPDELPDCSTPRYEVAAPDLPDRRAGLLNSLRSLRVRHASH